MYEQVGGQRRERGRRAGQEERMEGSAESPHWGGGGVTQGSKVEQRKAGELRKTGEEEC